MLDSKHDVLGRAPGAVVASTIIGSCLDLLTYLYLDKLRYPSATMVLRRPRNLLADRRLDQSSQNPMT